jgi:RNA polymerase sigma factor (TIGR02999 family)
MAEPHITTLLRELSQGEASALDRLVPLVYEELRRIARAQLRGERAGHTLDSTALVHEAYLRFLGINQVQWQDRNHFVAVATRVMRRVLIDHARGAGRTKRGGGVSFVSLSNARGVAVISGEQLIHLDESLVRLEALNERACRVVECRCFGGLSVEETADALGTSPATVKRDWVFSRAWLNREMERLGTGAVSG